MFDGSFLFTYKGISKERRGYNASVKGDFSVMRIGCRFVAIILLGKFF